MDITPTPDPEPGNPDSIIPLGKLKLANFDSEARALREDLRSKGVLLVVFEAHERGTGISVQVSPQAYKELPRLLRRMANAMEKSVKAFEVKQQRRRNGHP